MFPNLLSFIPLPYRILGIIALLVAFGFTMYNKGAQSQRTVYETQLLKEQAEFFKKGVASVTVTERVVVKYKDRIIHVEKARNDSREQIAKEIGADDSIPVGFVRMHDKTIANQNGDANAIGRIDEATSGISTVNLREASEIIVNNYATCYAWKS